MRPTQEIPNVGQRKGVLHFWVGDPSRASKKFPDDGMINATLQSVNRRLNLSESLDAEISIMAIARTVTRTHTQQPYGPRAHKLHH